MTILQTIILGIIEGVTEFLPISSTGHLILTNKLLGVADSDFNKSFEIVIQFGAILSVVVLYWKKFIFDSQSWKKVLIAFAPTAFLGFVFYKIIKSFLLSNSIIVLWSLFLGGFALILFEVWHKSRQQPTPNTQYPQPRFAVGARRATPNTEISYRKSFVIGIVQSLSMIPGISRAGATIVGGLLMGINRQSIVEFSFLLAVPTMAAATIYDLFKSAGNFSLNEFHILVLGFIVSFVVALLSVKWLLHFIKNHTFIYFGIYRIIVAVLFWIFVIR